MGWKLCDLFPVYKGKEEQMFALNRSEPVRRLIRGALSLGLAFAVMRATSLAISTVMQGQGWLRLLQIANSQGWHLSYGNRAGMTIYFTSLIVGALFAGLILAVCFGELNRIRVYLLATLLGWVGPFVPIRVIGILQKFANSAQIQMIFSLVGVLLIGLGFGILYCIISRDPKTRSWLLLTGFVGYFFAHQVGLILLPLVPDPHQGFFNWRVLAVSTLIYGVEGGIMGGMLGVVSQLKSKNRH